MPSEFPPETMGARDLADPKKEAVDYTHYVESKNFGEYKKCALDLALFLNSPDLAVTGNNYDARGKAEMRSKVFGSFCAVCARAGVEIPSLESDLYVPFVPADPNAGELEPKAKKIAGIKRFITDQIEHSSNEGLKDQITTIADFLFLFTEKFDEGGGYASISIKEINALLNAKLVEAGLQPVRPDYATLELETAMAEQGPLHATKLLIVDDDFGEIINSMIRLAGWPNVSIDYYLHQRDYSDKRDKDEKIKAISMGVLEKSPQIVLMDQGLDRNVDGSDVIHAFNDDARFANIRYVANTGGEDDKLRSEGAYPNFDKGKNVTGLRSALTD